MSSPPTPSDSSHASHGSVLSAEGLPIDPPSRVSPVTTDAELPGLARRVDCRAPQLPLVAAPSSSSKLQPLAPPRLAAAPSLAPQRPAPGAGARPTKAPRLGPAAGSLLDDDDDELVDYFGGAGAGPVAVPADDDVAVPGAPWDVRERHVRGLPSFYPLEKSSVVVRAAASTVAARVVTALKSRGVAASYDAPNAKADCVSADEVEFRVRLYRGRREMGGLIVEVQRRDGFALSYIQDVFAILDAAQGKELEEPETDVDSGD